MINSDTQQDQMIFIEWYDDYIDSYDNFKYSFSFLTGLLKELEKRAKIWDSYTLSHKIQLWIENVHELIQMHIKLKKLLTDQLYSGEMDDMSHRVLIDIKKKLVDWLYDDRKRVNEIAVIHAHEGNVLVYEEGYKLRPYVLQGKLREEAEYRIYANTVYLNQLIEYFVKCEELTQKINNLSDVDVSFDYDIRLRIQQDAWKP